MPREIGSRQLVPGDVLMVARDMRDKRTDKPFVWRFFLVVLEHEWEQVDGLRLGAPDGSREEMSINLEDDRSKVQFLDPDEWPDGVCAFRMMLALEGKIEGLV